MVVKGPVKIDIQPKQPDKKSIKKQPKVEKAVLKKEPIKPIEEVVLQEEDEVSKILSELDKKD